MVAFELAQHLESLTPLPGARVEGPSLAGLLFYSREKKPLNRNYFNQTVWRPALERAGVPRERGTGMHALRHSCASLWLEHGVSIKAVSEYLGHADPGFTLRVYTHVMPSSGDKARAGGHGARKGRSPDARRVRRWCTVGARDGDREWTMMENNERRFRRSHALRKRRRWSANHADQMS